MGTSSRSAIKGETLIERPDEAIEQVRDAMAQRLVRQRAVERAPLNRATIGATSHSHPPALEFLARNAVPDDVLL